jgi:hypothetical protein
MQTTMEATIAGMLKHAAETGYGPDVIHPPVGAMLTMLARAIDNGGQVTLPAGLTPSGGPTAAEVTASVATKGDAVEGTSPNDLAQSPSADAILGQLTPEQRAAYDAAVLKLKADEAATAAAIANLAEPAAQPAE